MSRFGTHSSFLPLLVLSLSLPVDGPVLQEDHEERFAALPDCRLSNDALSAAQPFNAFTIGPFVKENPPENGGKGKTMVGHVMFGMLYEVGSGRMLVYGD